MKFLENQQDGVDLTHTDRQANVTELSDAFGMRATVRIKFCVGTVSNMQLVLA